MPRALRVQYPGAIYHVMNRENRQERSFLGYQRTACDYVHLNPVRAGLIGKEDRLLAYPWSSLVWYLAAPEHRPGWMRVDRLLGEHGIPADSAAGGEQFERRMEQRRMEEEPETAVKVFRRGWCLGSKEFKEKMLELMDGKLGENHSGQLHFETAEQKAGRIIAEELLRRKWTEADLAVRMKNDPAKLAIAERLRKETTLSIKWIAARLALGTPKSARALLHQWMQNHAKLPKPEPCAQLQFQPMVTPFPPLTLLHRVRFGCRRDSGRGLRGRRPATSPTPSHDKA